MYGDFAYLSSPYWLVVGNASRPWNVPRRPKGGPRAAKIEELRLPTKNLGIPPSAFCPHFVVTAVLDGFAYLVSPRWAVGGTVRLLRNGRRGPAER